jgi:hypothetical protein
LHSTSTVSSVFIGRGSSWEERALRMLPITFVYVCVSVSKSCLCSSLRISFRVVSHKSSIAFVLTQLLNMLVYAGFTVFIIVVPTFPPKISRHSLHFTHNLHFLIFITTEPSFRILSKNFLETDLEALYDKMFPFFHFVSLYLLWLAPSALQHRGTQLIPVIPETRQRDAKNTYTLTSLGRNWYTAVICKMTAGRN